MNFRINDKSGSSILTTPIIIAIGMLFVMILVLTTVEVIIPYLWYEKLSSSCIKYLFIMEEFGYLTSKEANVLKADLESQGFDVDKITLRYTNNKVKYGEPIFLEVGYKYNMQLPIVGERIIEMNVERNSISKRWLPMVFFVI